MRIWDVHCHLEDSQVAGKTLSEKVDSAVAAADTMGIERLGLIMILKDDDAEVEKALLRRRDRTFGYIWVSLWDTPVEKNLALIERWIANGPAVGIKLGGWSGFPDRPEYEPVFRRVAELKGLILIHTWNKIGGNPPYFGGGNLSHEPKPEHVARLARRNPDIPFILGHTGGDWELGIRAVRTCPNVYAEISGGFAVSGEVEMAVRELGVQRVMYGSDIAGRGFASQLAKVYDAEIPERDKELIFSGNIRKMAAPIMTAKGMKP